MNLDLNSTKKSLSKALLGVNKYTALLFFLFTAAVYGFIIYRINVLTSVEPDQSAVAQASQGPKQPHIDPALIQKIHNLQDNSVNVQSLFDQARQNPFQE